MRYSLSVSVLLSLTWLFASAQTAAPLKKGTTSSRKTVELTLAGLRPGRSTLSRAVRFFGKGERREDDLNVTFWRDGCLRKDMFIDSEANGRIESVRVSEIGGSQKAECASDPKGVRDEWATGRGLTVGSLASRVTELYGNPDSRSPSSKGGQQLELLYYSFDWAGPDVPQVMEVLCTPEKDGKPGRVVEITLAASSL
jgi:hypothetical protein